MESNHYTLITGASQGIGKAFAMECASRGQNILLVALPESPLHETAEEIEQQYGVMANILAIDLTESAAPENVFQWCLENNYRVNFLINNAGLAGTHVFEEDSTDHIDKMLLLNLRAFVLLTKYFIPMLKEEGPSHILNIASLSAFYAIPFKAVYSASKSFMVQLSKALRSELQYSGISVSVVCPNGVDTNMGTSERIKAHGLMGRLTQISATDLARYTIKKVYQGKKVIVPKAINRILLQIKKGIPESLLINILNKEFGKEMRKKS